MVCLRFNYVGTTSEKTFCKAFGTVEGLNNLLEECKEVARDNNATIEDVKWK